MRWTSRAMSNYLLAVEDAPDLFWTQPELRRQLRRNRVGGQARLPCAKLSGACADLLIAFAPRLLEPGSVLGVVAHLGAPVVLRRQLTGQFLYCGGGVVPESQSDLREADGRLEIGRQLVRHFFRRRN